MNFFRSTWSSDDCLSFFCKLPGKIVPVMSLIAPSLKKWLHISQWEKRNLHKEHLGHISYYGLHKAGCSLPFAFQFKVYLPRIISPPCPLKKRR